MIKNLTPDAATISLRRSRSQVVEGNYCRNRRGPGFSMTVMTYIVVTVDTPIEGGRQTRETDWPCLQWETDSSWMSEHMLK